MPFSGALVLIKQKQPRSEFALITVTPMTNDILNLSNSKQLLSFDNFKLSMFFIILILDKYGIGRRRMSCLNLFCLSVF